MGQLDIFSSCSPIKSAFSPRKHGGSPRRNPLSPRKLRLSPHKRKGFDTTSAGCGTGMCGTHLSSRRELVEQLDPEQIFDYLIQNGALQPEEVAEIRKEKTTAKVNVALLKTIENKDKGTRNLFVNALRQSGQHQMASLLDDGARLKKLSGSGFLSKARHKGQVSMRIAVTSVKLDHTKLQSTNSSPSSKPPSSGWLSIEDIQVRIKALMESVQRQEPVSQFSLDQPDTPKKNSPCICSCFTQMFRRNKNKGNNNASDMNTKNASTNGNGISAVESKYIVDSPKDGRKSSLENLKNQADTFNQNAELVYTLLSDKTKKSHTNILKYFEQSRGMLVLSSDTPDVLVVSCICMSQSQLEALGREYKNGTINHQIEACVVNDELHQIGIQGVKLRTDFSDEELEIVEAELS